MPCNVCPVMQVHGIGYCPAAHVILRFCQEHYAVQHTVAQNCFSCGQLLLWAEGEDADRVVRSFGPALGRQARRVNEQAPVVVDAPVPEPPVRRYSASDLHAELVDGPKLGRAPSSSTPRLMGPPSSPVRSGARYDRPKSCLLDELVEEKDNASLKVAMGTPFHPELRDMILFLRAKMKFKNKVGESSPALQYSAFYAVTSDHDSPCNFMLGWDHAAILEKRDDGFWYAHSVYSASYSVGSTKAEAMVWRVHDKAAPEALPFVDDGAHMKEIPGPGAKASRTWARFDLASQNVKLNKVVTFGLTSCSFACLFNDKYILLSHMSSKLIPVAWLAVDVLGLERGTPMRLLASHHGDPTEYEKYTTLEGMPMADRLSISSVLCSRGVKHLPVELGTYTPSLTHPYMGLNLLTPGQVSCFSVLGYNNDPSLLIEKPPLHILWPLFFQRLTTTTDVQLILDIMGDAIAGNYGFDELISQMLTNLVQAHTVYKLKAAKDFSSPLIVSFFKEIEPQSSWTLSGKVTAPAKVTVPLPLKGWERIIFLLMDVIRNFTTPLYKPFVVALLEGWNQYQKGFVFRLDLFDTIPVPELRGRAVPKIKAFMR